MPPSTDFGNSGSHARKPVTPAHRAPELLLSLSLDAPSLLSASCELSESGQTMPSASPAYELLTDIAYGAEVEARQPYGFPGRRIRGQLTFFPYRVQCP